LGHSLYNLPRCAARRCARLRLFALGCDISALCRYLRLPVACFAWLRNIFCERDTALLACGLL
jgi:hypothetical protein